MGIEVIDVHNRIPKDSEHTLEKQGDKFLISPKLTIRILSFDPLFLTHVTLMMSKHLIQNSKYDFYIN